MSDKINSTTTLTYWNGRGLADCIRLMLSFCKEPYQECVPGFPGVKFLSKPEHIELLRENGYLLCGSVPLLCIDGMKLVQSQSIVRFLARKHKLCGDGSLLQEVKCDIMAESKYYWLFVRWI